MSTSFKNCTHVVKTRLLEGSMSYKAIANEARALFPDARTSDKSVASIARDMRKAGLLGLKAKGAAVVEEPIEEQTSMFPIFEATEFQPTLI